MGEYSGAFVGFDTSKTKHAVAIAEGERGGEVRFLGEIASSPARVERLVGKLAARYDKLHFCYEAGPTGYGLYRQIRELGHDCTVVAPSLIPKRPGERIKTNRRDAVTLARLLRAGELTAVWVPDAVHEAVRDLVRTRAAAAQDLRRAAKRRTDAEIADIENQHRPHGFARLPALGDKRSNALDAADGPIVVEGHRRVLRCRAYADQVRVHVIGVQDREGPYVLLFRCTRLSADRAGKGVGLRVDRVHCHSLPLCLVNGFGLCGLPALIRLVEGRQRQFASAHRSGYGPRLGVGMIAMIQRKIFANRIRRAAACQRLSASRLRSPRARLQTRLSRGRDLPRMSRRHRLAGGWILAKGAFGSLGVHVHQRRILRPRNSRTECWKPRVGFNPTGRPVHHPIGKVGYGA
jgi:Transposase